MFLGVTYLGLGHHDLDGGTGVPGLRRADGALARAAPAARAAVYGYGGVVLLDRHDEVPTAHRHRGGDEPGGHAAMDGALEACAAPEAA